MEKSNVKVVSDGQGSNTHVYVDGERLKNVQSLTYYINSDGVGILSLDLVGAELVLEGKFRGNTFTAARD